MLPPTVTLENFVQWVRQIMQVPATAIADDSVFMLAAFECAKAWMPHYPSYHAVARLYTLAVFNLGGSLLLHSALDVPPSTYFADARKELGIGALSAGMVSSASDESTSSTLTLSEALSNLSLFDLQRLQDPYGREALAFMMELGSLWGLT